MPTTVYPHPFIISPPADLASTQPRLMQLARELSICYAHHELVTEERLQQVGALLWESVGDVAAFAAHKQAAGMQVMPVVVQSEAAAVQFLPWECLYHPEFGFLAKHAEFTVSRQLVAQADVSLGELAQAPLRVLLFSALPDSVSEQGRLDVEGERAQVLEALTPLIQQGLVELVTPDDGRFELLKTLLQQQSFQLVFLTGHGVFHGQPHEPEAYGEFLFERADGAGHLVRDKELAAAFVGSGVRCVVLSACQSGQASSDALSAGLMQRLLAQGMPLVVGMRESIFDRAGILLARAFLEALASRERVDIALQRARQAMTQPLSDVTHRDLSPDKFAQLSLGQWCLPMLFAQSPELPLVSWAFTPQPRLFAPTVEQLGEVSLPRVFIGRRTEQRLLWQQLQAGQRSLLVTGAGGQGKTALVGQLALQFQAQGYLVLTFSARPEHGQWEEFWFNAQLELSPEFVEAFDKKWPLCRTPAHKARLLLRVLMQQTQGRLVLLLDNLESVQDAGSHQLTDEQAVAFLAEVQRLGASAPVLLLTSRWLLPEWSGAHHGLQKPLYGDFLRFVQQWELKGISRAQLRQLYEGLGGNFKGVELFAAAWRQLGQQGAAAFLVQLGAAQAETQNFMMIARLFEGLSVQAQALLQRLPAFRVPVPLDGIRYRLATDDVTAKVLLMELVAVSLVEVSVEPETQARRFMCVPLVREWLAAQGFVLELAWLQAAAGYLVEWFEEEQRTLEQALAAHQALVVAAEQEQANKFALDYLVPYFDRVGLYQTLLDEWLPVLRASEEKKLKGEAFGYSGKVCHAMGQYDTALDYLKQSLAIRQEIGDKSGEGTTLNNISQIFKARGDYATALDYLKQSLAIQKEIGDKSGEGTTLNNISLIYDARGDYATALDYLKQSLAIQKEIGDKSGEGSTLNNIGQIFQARGDYATALDYLKQSLAIRQEIGDKSGEGTTLNNISQIYDARGDYATALDYLKQSLAIFQDIGDKAHVGGTLNNISQIFKARGEYATALDYLKQSLAIQQEIGDMAGVCGGLINMGAICFEQEKPEEGISHFLAGYQLAKQLNHAQALGALESLAKQLGGTGLDTWEQLSQQLQQAES